MSEKTDKILQEIAIKHGIVLGKDDPILILQTMNDRLIEETRQAQAEMLVQFKEEMESISSLWKDDARNKTEKLLNAALVASKEAMAKLLRESSSQSAQAIKKVMFDALNEKRDLTQQTRKFNQLTLMLSAAMLITTCLFMLSC
ncbi:conjugal transfer protein TraM [Legionella pneumophila serogroup 1]